jgi:putative peptidoglycan lipid II flippase
MQIGDAQRALSSGWRQLATGSVNRRIFGAAVTVGTISLSIGLVTVVKDVVVVASFGIGNSLDAFLIALVLPNFVIGLAASSFNAALVPIYIEVREKEGQIEAQRLFWGVTLLSAGLLTLVVALLALAGPALLPVIGSGFGPQKQAVALGLFFALLPTVVLNGLASIWASVLNASERFALAAASSVTVPLSMIGCLLVFGEKIGIFALAWGMLLGIILQLGVLAYGLSRQGISVVPRIPSFHPAMRRVIAQYLPMVAGSALMSGSLLIDQSMAAMLRPGSVATLNYGNKLVTLFISIGTMALGTAVLPFFSKMVAARDWPTMRHSLRTYTRLILLITVPLTIVAIALSLPIVWVLFQRGQFTEADTARVAGVQAMYLLQVPFYTLGILFVRIISSLQANYILMWGTAISFVINVTLDYLLMQVFGVAGIALSTAFVYVVACIYLSRMLFWKLRSVERQVE